MGRRSQCAAEVVRYDGLARYSHRCKNQAKPGKTRCGVHDTNGELTGRKVYQARRKYDGEVEVILLEVVSEAPKTFVVTEPKRAHRSADRVLRTEVSDSPKEALVALIEVSLDKVAKAEKVLAREMKRLNLAKVALARGLCPE